MFVAFADVYPRVVHKFRLFCLLPIFVVDSSSDVGVLTTAFLCSHPK